ncbi:tellurite resistance TerB family protein [Nitratireductor sp. ZSWI3]|uniref:tellurite resistance TerB family protein n=1 Tax=Nitratireductor sp. ZSWI3 TaxID=2966359 RepID=UPI0021503B57|nr:tellurite resistance TerB family protein [Nitratireductor sp. ZSWI3]MCR4268962.1 tellurite resistance TerB family protein [Nitratireductor sp. ZSWI3]
MAEPSAHEALIYLMVVMSAADRDMTDAELAIIGNTIRTWPVFRGFDENRIIDVARQCQQILQEDSGLERILNAVRDTVPAKLHDTAYALAVEVAAADRHVEPEEARMLHIVRSRLHLEPLVAAAIERTVQARRRALA